MADVFISYKSDRRPAAEHLAEVLEHHGYSVWFDYALLSGNDFGRQIEQELKNARAVVVLWCDLSVDSDWVRSEARYAKRTAKFCPVKIAACDLPIEFDGDQTQDLTKWDGAPKPFEPGGLLREISTRIGREPKPDLAGLDQATRAWRRYGGQPLAELGTINPIETRRKGHAPDFAGGTSTPHSTGFVPEKQKSRLPALAVVGGIAGGVAVTGIAIAFMLMNTSGRQPASLLATSTEQPAETAMTQPVTKEPAPNGSQDSSANEPPESASGHATDGTAGSQPSPVPAEPQVTTRQPATQTADESKPDPEPVPSYEKPRQRSNQELIVGTWECVSFGSGFSATGTIIYDASGTSRGSGTLQGFDPDTGAEISMSFRGTSNWRLSGNLLYDTLSSIDVDNILINGVSPQAFAGSKSDADIFEQQFEQELLYEAQLSDEPSTIEMLTETALMASTTEESTTCTK